MRITVVFNGLTRKNEIHLQKTQAQGDKVFILNEKETIQLYNRLPKLLGEKNGKTFLL